MLHLVINLLGAGVLFPATFLLLMNIIGMVMDSTEDIVPPRSFLFGVIVGFTSSLAIVALLLIN